LVIALPPTPTAQNKIIIIIKNDKKQKYIINHQLAKMQVDYLFT
jgi:hypothetical protein